ncbi:MAG TPA: hypothetical protein P5077_07475 [bacterium]|nr:hypothetical protein [bacterium]
MRYVIGILTVLATTALFGGGAFAEAIDKEGNSSTWTFFQKDKAGAAAAQAEAIKKLKEQGHAKVSSPASTGMDHGVYVVIFTAYEHKGEARWSHGFGIHAKSEKEAEKAAVANLKKKDKFWKPDYGYDVKETKNF